jgi:polyisoprenoid-binding protein YceI
MKTLKYLSLALFVAIAFASCGDSAKTTTANDADSVATPGSAAATYKVDIATSELRWYGKKMAYGHGGLVNITQGSLSLENGNISAGNFTVDMNTIRETGNDDAGSAAKLEGHLKSEDFFMVEKYPTSKFEVTASTPAKTDTTTHTIKGNLTIKDVTKNIEFPANVVVDGNNLTANASFSINRNDWGVVYGSGLSGAIGDKIISDNIDYKVTLKATKQ